MKRSVTRKPKIEEKLEVIVKSIIEACQEAHGREIVALEVAKLTDIAKYLVVVSGRSDRQVQGIGRRVLETAEQIGVESVSVEGMDQGHWVLVDLGEIIVHVFYESVRDKYDIEGLWCQAPQLEIDGSGTTRSQRCGRAA